MRLLSGEMVVSVGLLYRPSSMSSNPTTAMSSGTLMPSSMAARRMPIAMRSLYAKMASGGRRLHELSKPDGPVRAPEVVGGHDEFRVVAESGSQQGFPVSEQAQVGRLPVDVGLRAHERDPAPTEIEQI